ncbi:MAG TPA: EAL domain-containing protein [Pseudolabrys sp.]|nr:EAL domain-containing protein [Pseudolabrys sp.]
MTTHDHGGEDQESCGSLEPARARVSIEDALSGERLEVWYQPKIDLRRKCLAGAEAFVRIHHPDAGLLWPEDYLDGLDETDQLKLSEYLFVTCLRHWTTFAEAGFGLRLSVNMPAHLLPKIPIDSLIAAHRPQSERWPGLIFELKEDQIIRDMPVMRKIAKDLKSSGIVLAIGEFGAGYSSLSSLRDLSFAELKLAASFVRNCAVDVTNAGICQTAIDLAHRFGSVVVADGIDAIADLQALIVMGCDHGQGMLVAPPLPKDRFLVALRQHMNRPRSGQHLAPSSDERVA